MRIGDEWTGSLLCPMGGFDINSADPSGSTIRVSYDGQGIEEG